MCSREGNRSEENGKCEHVPAGAGWADLTAGSPKGATRGRVQVNTRAPRVEVGAPADRIDLPNKPTTCESGAAPATRRASLLGDRKKLVSKLAGKRACAELRRAELGELSRRNQQFWSERSQRVEMIGNRAVFCFVVVG